MLLFIDNKNIKVMLKVENEVTMSEIAAIVVTYNRKELLLQCIKKLMNQSVKTDILVIDNASTDGTNELQKCDDYDIIYYNTGQNLGGAGGFYFGIKKAVERGYKYIWILDDDTMPRYDTLENFMKVDQELNGRYGFLSSKVLWKDDSICAMNIQKRNKWQVLRHFDKMCNVQYASFVSLFLRTEIVKTVGLPYRDFFIWADDWEYTRRISKFKEGYFVPNSIVWHWCNSNVGANIVTADESRLSRFSYMYRNDVVMYRQDGFEGYLYLIIRNLIHIYRVVRSHNDIARKIKLIIQATWSGLSFHPKIDFPKGK